MLDLPFLLPFADGPFSYSAGFFIWFLFLWMGFLALGLALEALITILTPKSDLCSWTLRADVVGR